MNKKQSITVAASILTADFLNLKTDLDKLIAAGIKIIHYDVMDNHFVNNLSFGPKILQDICHYVQKFNVIVDCHFMVNIPKDLTIQQFLKPYQIAGVNNVTFHYEALTVNQRQSLINDIKNFKIGLAFNPDTPVDKIYPFIEQVNLILIMSVNPGFGSQPFITATYQKLQNLQIFMTTNHIKKGPFIAVDGGINAETGPQCYQAGANYLVSGSYLLNSNDIKHQIDRITNHE